MAGKVKQPAPDDQPGAVAVYGLAPWLFRCHG